MLALVAVPGLLAGCGSNMLMGDLGGDDLSGPAGQDGGDAAGTPELSDQAVPDFALTDVNPNSSRYQEIVSPRDYLGGISAWYFGHST